MKKPTSAQTAEPLVELRLWRQFAVLAEELHFGRAAKRLHMTQPPLTQAIANLEVLLQVRLFDRSKRSVQLTAAAAVLLPHAYDLIARASAMPRHARDAANGQAGTLRLAFVSTVGFDLLPRWLRAFRSRHPQVGMELMEATGDVQPQALERGEVDAGFMLHSPGFHPPGLARLRIAQDRLVLALPKSHPLAAHEALRLADVLGEALVIFPRRILPSLYDAIFAMYHASGQPLQVAQEAIQMQTIVNLVSAGMGLAWVPASVKEFQRPGVVYRPVAALHGRGKRHAVVPECETSLVWNEASGNPVLQRFVEFARQQAGK